MSDAKYLEVSLTRDGVRASWSYADEGMYGFYNPDDTGDIALLRFDVCRFVDGEWEYVEDSSYCTMVPFDTDEVRLVALLQEILDEVADDVCAGISVKKKCEQLSWMTA